MKQKKSGKYVILARIIMAVVFYLVIILTVLYVGIRNREKRETADNVSEVIKQGSRVMTDKVDDYFGELEELALMLKENDDLFHADTLQKLEVICSANGASFQKLELADLDGNSWGPKGAQRDVKEEKFFRESIAGKKYIAYGEAAKDSFTVSVPLFTESGSVRGVLWGTSRDDIADIYTGTSLEQDIRDVFVIRSTGHFIVGTSSKEESPGSIFDYLKQYDTSISMIRLKNRLSLGQMVDVKVKRQGQQDFFFFYPCADRGWYVVTVVDAAYMAGAVYGYGREILLLTGELALLVIALCVLLFRHMEKEAAHVAKLDRKLELNEETYRITAQQSAVCVFTYDVEKQQVHFLNDKYQKLDLNQPVLSMPILMKTMEEREKGVCDKIRLFYQAVEEKQVDAEQEISMHLRGTVRFFQIHLHTLYDENKNPLRCIGTIEDITEMRENRLLLKKEEAFRNTLLSDCLGYLEVNVTRDKVLKSTSNIVWDESRLVSYTRLLESWMSKRMDPQFWNEMSGKLSCEGILKLYQNKDYDTLHEYLCQGNNGESYWASCEVHIHASAENEDVIAYLVYRNIDEKKKRQMNLENQAKFDLLTGVYNRLAGTMQIRQLLNAGTREDTVHAFLMADMDNFKKLNDTLGHIWGDKALIDVAKTMKQHVRPEDVVCRLGGDEFVLFIQNVPRSALNRIVEALVRKMNLTYEKDGTYVTVTASIGIAIAPQHGNTFEELYAQADKALYKVKKETKNGYYICEEPE